jgi:hypothetical protein
VPQFNSHPELLLICYTLVMNNSQKGSTALTVSLVIIFLLVMICAAYFYFKPAQTMQVISTAQPVGQNTQTPVVTPPAETATPTTSSQPVISPITKVYSDHTFGFSTTYSKSFTSSIDKQGKVTFSIPGAPGITPITIVKTTGTADTSTGKWGKNILSYGPSGWTTQLQKQDGSIYSAATVPFSHTTTGLPIFTAGTPHGFGLSVYVVALSHTKFLIISSGEGVTTSTGYDFSTDPALQVAKAVTLI